MGPIHRADPIDDAAVDPELLEAWLADEGFEEGRRSELVRPFPWGRRLLRADDEERP